LLISKNSTVIREAGRSHSFWRQKVIFKTSAEIREAAQGHFGAKKLYSKPALKSGKQRRVILAPKSYAQNQH
jgi:hypothetical protein